MRIPRAGFLAPDFNLRTLDGSHIRLSTLRGRPVLINIWASWCIPCKAEMPSLEQIYQEYNKQGLEILAVNSTIQDDPSKVLDFAHQSRLTFPILLDPTGEVPRLYNIQALPTSFFVDASGTIREVVVGGPISEALLRIRVEALISVIAGQEAP